jgi:hypothetical protein
VIVAGVGSSIYRINEGPTCALTGFVLCDICDRFCRLLRLLVRHAAPAMPDSPDWEDGPDYTR